MKPAFYQAAVDAFTGTGITIIHDGTTYLGSAIGNKNFTEQFIKDKIAVWTDEVLHLAAIAATEPHAAYAVLTHGFSSKWTYTLHTLNVVAESLEPLMQALNERLLPAITGRFTWTDAQLKWMQLPIRLGGLGFPNVTESAKHEYRASIAVTREHASAIISQHDTQVTQVNYSAHQSLVTQLKIAGFTAKADVRKTRQAKTVQLSLDVDNRLSSNEKRARCLVAVKGASSWLSVLPLREHHFHLSKGDFRDALALRFVWPIPDLPTLYSCGKDFNPTHAMICPQGGFPTIRHNEVRDMLGGLLTEVCRNVALEPCLASLTGESFPRRTTNVSDGARADIKARGFWTSHEDAFFDVRVFCPDASSYLDKALAEVFALHERLKRNEYAHRICAVDHVSFCPLVFSTQGGCGKEATTFLKSLANQLSEKDGKPYSITMDWIRCRLSFALLRSAVMCIRGSRSAFRRPFHCDRELAVVDGRLQA